MAMKKNACYKIIILFILGCFAGVIVIGKDAPKKEEKIDVSDVCPPFVLKDENGNIINPAKGINDNVPYSPKQTCGSSGCHDYEKITEGFHFMQGKGEVVPEKMKSRYNWVSSPGNYGGNWCSPAPLYRQLAAKHNINPRLIDMTSFEFVTATCGNCHPGGGPLEYDREGRRYDKWMSDAASGLVSGGDNNFDGDYYKARWSETGVIEADCLMCHMPEYNFKKRNEQLTKLNFRWAATEGAGFGHITGSILEGTTPEVDYDKSKFDENGNVIVHIVPEPRNETCLSCHAKPDWKKKGTSYSVRTDVHIAAGIKCVDCHPAGSKAKDERIRGKELHQFSKGDDPSGWVRNDLDNTVRSCEDCHINGWINAPKAKHSWLPPLHLEKISCQACHIPYRAVKSAVYQASDIYNPSPRITPPPKRIWAFYDQNMVFWNHYGELELFTAADKPTDITKPTLFRYKGKIYPGNVVHSSWIGFIEEGKPGLNQLFMKDFYQMWVQHNNNPIIKYHELNDIIDDNGDGIIEVNKPNEIDALLAATNKYLSDTNFPMNGKRLVWVYDDKIYYSSKEYRKFAKEDYEATPFASVYKFSHDVAPAKAALGINGCRDCHSKNSSFFYAKVLQLPFDEHAEPVWMLQSQFLKYTGTPPKYVGIAGSVASFFDWLTVVVMILLIGHILMDISIRFGKRSLNKKTTATVWVQRFNIHFRAQHLMLLSSVLLLFLSGIFLWGLRYPGAKWASALTSAFGGIDFWRIIHRIGGAGLIMTCLYHIFYSILHEEGRRDFILMLPRKYDFTTLWQNIKYFLRFSKEAPKFGRFTYFEKFDYWAVFWGSAIMIGTGLAMWFHDILKLIFPSVSMELLNAFKEAHAHEALLAFLAIVIWHIYNVHFRGNRFPISWLWVHGKMTKDDYDLEHPLDDTIK